MGKPSLRILHVQHSLGAGGMENGVVNVANTLAGDGFDFHVCCLAYRGEFASRMPSPEQVYVLDKGEGFSMRTVFKLNRRLREVRPDVIHTHNLGALIYASLATVFGHLCPILHGEHGQPPEPESGNRWFAEAKRRWFYHSAAKVHTVSHSLRDYFIANGVDADRVVALVNGVDTERFRPGDKSAARKSLNLPEEAPVALVVGRLIASKRHELLFKAFEDVVRRWPEATLCVVGDGGDEAARIKSAASESPIAKSIRMEGYQSDPLPYYQAADLLAVPSTIEGLSNVVLEAMSAGLPALVHNACGNGEVIESGNTGVVEDLSTREGLSTHLAKLLDNPSFMQQMGAAARVAVQERFSLESMANAYASTYRSVARPMAPRSDRS